ncbi:hypothetical protein [Streptococcus equi]
MGGSDIIAKLIEDSLACSSSSLIRD